MNAAPATQRGITDCRHDPWARTWPNARHNGGNAGRMYVGSLHAEVVKNATHQPAARSMKPSSGDRNRTVVSSRASRKRPNDQRSNDPGNRPTSRTGP